MHRWILALFRFPEAGSSTRFSKAAVILVVMAAFALSLNAQNISIQKQDGVYKVIGWRAAAEPVGGWASVFAVYAGEGDIPPMLGSYSVDQGTLVFRPKYPPSPGLNIRAVFHAPGRTAIVARFAEPKLGLEPSAYVEHVYPSANMLPDNLLKFYIQFSAPMSRGEAWDRIHLLDESGSRVELAFLPIVQELWDHDNRRLTVLFDPGRIKRGLIRRDQLGPPLVEGKQYSLVIDRDFADAVGTPMRAEFRKTFRVAQSDRVPPETSDWKLAAPKANTTDGLIVTFGKPMDWAMLQRALEVRGGGGRIAGSFTITRNETEWRFIPAGPWKPGTYELIVDRSLEDLAGNRIGRAFDVDLDRFDKITETIERQTSTLQFQVVGR